MSKKIDKLLGVVSIADRKRAEPPVEVRPSSSKRRRNQEQGISDLTHRAECGDSQAKYWLAYILGKDKKRERERAKKAIKCVCGHRGDKHRSWQDYDYHTHEWIGPIKHICHICECKDLVDESTVEG